MFLMHAIYGFGATVSPLVSTEFVKSLPTTVYYYFAVSLGLALFTCLTLFVVFRLRTEDQIVGRRESEAISSTSQEHEHEGINGESAGEKRDREMMERREAGSSGNKMKRIMKTPAVHFMAFYIMIYVGVEVTIGGWAVSLVASYSRSQKEDVANGRLLSSWMNEVEIRMLVMSRQDISQVSP
jgi:fucose permease